MQIFRHVTNWLEYRQQINAHLPLGLVTTMGNLHLGHSSLINLSIQENAHTCVSIFVNPTQFNQAQDFDQYPRTLEQDLTLLEQLGVNSCLLPESEELYSDHYHYQVTEHSLSHIMEGKFRPGHFSGVLTVVLKLFNLVRPTNVYFGEKDYQQYLLIKQMVNAFFLNITVHCGATIREASGLAYSSRNNRLSLQGKNKAATFARIFLDTKDYQETLDNLKQQQIEVEYLMDYNNRRFIVVNLDNVRLIDNKPLGDSEPKLAPAAQNNKKITS